MRLKKGNIAFAPFLLKHPDREKFLHYSKEPYFLTTPSILVRPEFPIKDFKEMSDLKPYIIGFYLNGVIPPPLEKKLNIRRVGGTELHKRLIYMLKAKRVDGVLDLQQISLEFMKRLRGTPSTYTPRP